MYNKFLTALSAVKDIKKIEVPLPIARKAANITPLFVGDDLSLRTSMISPVMYDKDMIQLLFNHTSIVEHELSDGEKPKKWNSEKFKAQLSVIDKTCLIWGLYKSTYDTLGKRKIECTKENCNNTWESEVLLDDLVHEDTFTTWDEEVAFYEYQYPIDIPYEGFNYSFITSLPTMARNNAILSSISINAIQQNIEATNSAFSRTEQLALLTKTLKFQPNNGGDSVESTNIQDILIGCKDYVPQTVSEKFFEMYEERFGKYQPKFYKQMTCSVCNTEVTYTANLEVE